MFRHIVLLGLREATDSDAVAALVDALRNLPEEIPELRAYEIGLDAGLAEGNATVGVVADFDDEAGYLVYRDHPAHVAVIADHIRPILESRAAIQHSRV